MTRTANDIALPHEAQYHIGCKSGDVADHVILVGDPERAFRISNHFQKINFRKQHREYVTYTGEYNKIPLSVMAIGIGQGNMEIAVIEISQIVKNPTLIRCGTSSGLQKNIGLGDLVISETVHDLGNLSSYYKVPKKITASQKITEALIKASQNTGVTFHVGKTASAPGFYGPQQREISGFPIKNKNIISGLTRKKVLNLEMEMATMFSLSNVKKIQCGGICSAIGNRVRNDFLDEKSILAAEQQSIQVVLNSIKILHGK